MTSQSRVVDLTESNNDVGHLVPAAATKTSSDSRLHNSSKPGHLNNDYKNSPSSSALTHHHQRGADYGSAVTGVEQKVLTKSKSETTRLDRDNSSSRNVKRGGGNSRADIKPESSTVNSEYYVNSDAANSRDNNGTQQQRRRSRERSPEIVRSQLAKLPMPPTPPEQRCLANDKDDSLQRSVVLVVVLLVVFPSSCNNEIVILSVVAYIHMWFSGPSLPASQLDLAVSEIITRTSPTRCKLCPGGFVFCRASRQNSSSSLSGAATGATFNRRPGILSDLPMPPGHSSELVDDRSPSVSPGEYRRVRRVHVKSCGVVPL